MQPDIGITTTTSGTADLATNAPYNGASSNNHLGPTTATVASAGDISINNNTISPRPSGSQQQRQQRHRNQAGPYQCSPVRRRRNAKKKENVHCIHLRGQSTGTLTRDANDTNKLRKNI